MRLADTPRYSPGWLELREGADASARATALLSPLLTHLTGAASLVIRDLGCGTGSMARWLAGRLPGPQHWILTDRDPDLLDQALRQMPTAAADGTPVTAEARRADVAGLTAADLAGTSLVTASALLDLLTADEVEHLAAACVDAACPALFTLTVVGRVEMTPPDPLDAEMSAAFTDHLRRGVEHRHLLGPEAADAAAEAFDRRGATVRQHPSPWRLGPAQARLMAEWLRGWVPAAAAARPRLAAAQDIYLRRRLGAAAAGDLRVTVHHRDLLALPATSARVTS
jgi:hypothetical protein